MQKNTRRLPLVLLALAGVAACDGTLPFGEPAAAVSPRSAMSADSIPRGVDEQMVALARRIPGYGGHFTAEDGTVQVYVRQPAQAATARAVLRALAAEEGQQAEVQTLQGDYDFLELTRWRVRLARAVGHLPGVWRMGTSERNNRITIGVDSDDAALRVTDAIRRSGVPLAAVQIVRQQPVQRFAAGDSVTSFTSVVRGGFRIYTEQGALGGSGTCTAGPVGRGEVGSQFEGRLYMLTASHCTSTLDGVTGTGILQPSAGSGQIGVEAFDGREYQDGANALGCAYAEGCRQSDIALVELNGNRTAGVGQIARPSSRGTSSTAPGTLAINASSPIFRVTAWRANRLNTGITLHKVGGVSGWTSGSLVDSCDDNRSPDGKGGYLWIICENLVRNMYADQGDSGSPVFEYAGTGIDVKVVGILTGGTVISGVRHTVYDAIISFSTDLTLVYAPGGHPGVLGGSGSIQWLYGM